MGRNALRSRRGVFIFRAFNERLAKQAGCLGVAGPVGSQFDDNFSKLVAKHDLDHFAWTDCHVQ